MFKVLNKGRPFNTKVLHRLILKGEVSPSAGTPRNAPVNLHGFEGFDFVQFRGNLYFEISNVDVILQGDEIIIGNAKELGESQRCVNGNSSAVVKDVLNS